jgi:hypothetical protein
MSPPSRSVFCKWGEDREFTTKCPSPPTALAVCISGPHLVQFSVEGEKIKRTGLELKSGSRIIKNTDAKRLQMIANKEIDCKANVKRSQSNCASIAKQSAQIRKHLRSNCCDDYRATAKRLQND